MELDVVIENVSSSRQIEIGMVGQIEDRRFVSHSTIIDVQLRTLQSVDDLDTECPGIVFLTIPTDIGQTYATGLLILKNFRMPDFLIKPPDSSVQVVLPVVLSELNFVPVQ